MNDRFERFKANHGTGRETPNELHALAVAFIYKRRGREVFARGRKRWAADTLPRRRLEIMVRDLIGDLPVPEPMPHPLYRRAEPMSDFASDAELVRDLLNSYEALALPERMARDIRVAQTAELQEANHA